MPDGRPGESLAAEFLRSKGYDLIERNFRTRHGEIDIVARKDDTIHFIEVKTRSSQMFGSPLEAVTDKKYETMQQVALDYISEKHTEDTAWQIDVLSIQLHGSGTLEDIQLIEHV